MRIFERIFGDWAEMKISVLIPTLSLIGLFIYKTYENEIKMKTNMIQEGQMILCIKNEDKTFSMLGMTKEQGEALFLFLKGLSKDEPLVKSDIKLKEVE